MRPMMATLLNRREPVDQMPQYQFEAARCLRGAGWSHYRIAMALGLSLSQVRCAVDRKAQAAHDRWAA